VEGYLSDSKTDAPTEMRQRAELRDYLAAERTLLAWIRTGLALMGFGFVVARFGLFLQEIQVAQPTFSAHSYGLSLWFGTALIAAGVVVNLISGWQYSRLVRDLDRGQQTLHRPPALAVAITLFLALVGLAMTIYLISLRGSAHSNSGNNSRQNEEMPIAPTADNGIMSIPSNHSVDQTVEELKGILQAKGVTVFRLVEHIGEAEKVGYDNPVYLQERHGSPQELPARKLVARRSRSCNEVLASQCRKIRWQFCWHVV
jgi:inner membrane protein YidH